ncbi:MAG: metacaspase [Actinomycetota bacterium]|nr:metacaspase [Actinomycetota bacterium]
MRRILVVLGVLATITVLTVPLAGAATPPGDKWALIVGVDLFEGGTRPNFGGKADANDLRNVLLQKGFPADHIRVLTDAGATAADIRAGLAWLASSSSPKSFSVVSYSGHVKQVGSTEYLWPHDNVFIPDTEFAAAINQVKGKMWVNVSGCEAAGFDVGISSASKLFTASSLATEKSYEWPEAGASVFSYYMVRRGMLEGLADANRDFRISVQEAFRYAAANAPAFTAGQAQGAQHPQMAGGDGAELFLDDPLGGPAAAPGAVTPAATSGGGKSANCAILNCYK